MVESSKRLKAVVGGPARCWIVRGQKVSVVYMQPPHPYRRFLASQGSCRIFPLPPCRLVFYVAEGSWEEIPIRLRGSILHRTTWSAPDFFPLFFYITCAASRWVPLFPAIIGVRFASRRALLFTSTCSMVVCGTVIRHRSLNIPSDSASVISLTLSFLFLVFRTIIKVTNLILVTMFFFSSFFFAVIGDHVHSYWSYNLQNKPTKTIIGLLLIICFRLTTKVVKYCLYPCRGNVMFPFLRL